MEQPAFQVEAVKRIIERLSTRQGPRRYLLADEVGLGKTHVARAVMSELRRRKRRKLVVLYLCSNTEVASQNQRKLDPKNEAQSADRLTLLAPELGQLRDRDLVFLSLTPGTSLELTRSTGTVQERALLYLLLRQLFPKDRLLRCRDTFVGQAGDDTFRQSLRKWRADQRKISQSLKREVRRQWRPSLVQFGKSLERGFKASPKASKLSRDTMLRLREGLARAVLANLKPDLIILDEFQRFSGLLKKREEGKPEHLLSRHFFSEGRDGRVPLLLLSATPYRLYAGTHEDPTGTQHLQEFFGVLRFLRAVRDDDVWIDRLEDRFAKFRTGIEALARGEGQREQLLELKASIEEQLTSVMCRTERNWYYEDDRKGIEEVRGSESAHAPSRAELADYQRLSRTMLAAGESTSALIDYWKSCPRCLAFMQRHYRVRQRVKRDRVIRPTMSSLKTTVTENLRACELMRAVFASGGADHPRWKYLWTKPRYLYWKSDFFGEADPAKFLVFSHWRFVPGALALLASDSIERCLKIDDVRKWRGGRLLRFGRDRGLSTLDVVFPSPGLARAVNPIALAAEHLGDLDCGELERRARRLIRTVLRDSRIRVDSSGEQDLWRLIARIDRTCMSAEEAKLHSNLIRRRLRDRSCERAERRVLRAYGKWFDDNDEDLTISSKQLKRLVRVALYSPAVSLLRAVRREAAHGHSSEPLLRASLVGLRGFFNRTYAQAIIQRSSRSRTYHEQVLDYCRDAHFSPVIDEYIHLLASQYEEAEAAEKALDGVSHAISVEPGAPQVLLKEGPKRRRSHFALAFTEDTGTEQGRGKQRSTTREAFNSPFWPFILATTSLGQEGLDFHFYCRDIVHWNLPSNPVDLEQREGRINRRNSLLVREGVKRAVKLSSLAGADGSLWRAAFDHLTKQRGVHHTRHGLFPNWVNESGRGRSPRLRRHLLFYESSRDIQRYETLKADLALYRLAFGQARQEDLVRQMRELLDRRAGSRQDLEQFMINLSPFRRDYAWRAAKNDARERSGDSVWLRKLLSDTQQLLKRFIATDGHESWRTQAVADCERLRQALLNPSSKITPRLKEDAIAALVYLRNPYDDVFDRHRVVGLRDDAERLRAVARRLREA